MGKFRITKRHHFSAAHRLRNVPDGHPCGRLHGHNYVVEVVLEANVLRTPQEWVRDFGDLDVVWDWIDAHWDHRNLNEWARDEGAVRETTSEMLAWFLYERFQHAIQELAAVRVSETAKTWAEFRG